MLRMMLRTLEILKNMKSVIICMIMKVNTIVDILSFMIIYVYKLISMQTNIFINTLYANHQFYCLTFSLQRWYESFYMSHISVIFLYKFCCLKLVAEIIESAGKRDAIKQLLAEHF